MISAKKELDDESCKPILLLTAKCKRQCCRCRSFAKNFPTPAAFDDARLNANGAAFGTHDAALSSEAGKEGKIYQAITAAISQYDGKMHQCLTDALAENGVITNAIADAIADAKTDLTAELQNGYRDV